MQNSTEINEAEIRALINNRVSAVRAKDVARATESVAHGMVAFDVVNPLYYVGADASRRRAEEWFSSFNGPLDFEIRDLVITAGDDVAFCHGLARVKGTKNDGGKLEMWWRSTICCRRIDGKWMVTHEHNSVPFDVQTGLASLDLKP